MRAAVLDRGREKTRKGGLLFETLFKMQVNQGRVKKLNWRCQRIIIISYLSHSKRGSLCICVREWV